VQVAQPALAVLDVRLDEIAGLAGPPMPFLPLSELGGDEFRGGSWHHLFVEACDQFVVEFAVAEKKARLEHRGADGHVGLGRANALVDRACGVPDLKSHVPQAIQDRFGDGFAPGGLFVRKQEQEIDVGPGSEHAAAIAAGGDDRHVLGFGRVLRRVEVLDRELVENAHDLVLHGAEPLGAPPPVPVGDEQGLDRRAAARQRRAQVPRDLQPQFALVAGMDFAQPRKLRRDGSRIENFGFGRRLGRGQHGLTPG
jgi:hypothetical protein